MKMKIYPEMLPLEREDIKTLNFNVSAEYESYQAKDKLMLEECYIRSCEPNEAYDIDINPDDIDVTDNVTVVWGIK